MINDILYTPLNRLCPYRIPQYTNREHTLRGLINILLNSGMIIFYVYIYIIYIYIYIYICLYKYVNIHSFINNESCEPHFKYHSLHFHHIDVCVLLQPRQ